MKVEFQGTQETLPQWVGDFVGRLQNLPGGVKLDAAAFPALGDVSVSVGANAAIGATAVTVAALAAPIPAGTNLHFGGSKFASLTANAPASATTLAVVALPTALVTGDVSVYSGPNRRKFVPSGTLVGKLRSETKYGPAAAADEQAYLLLFDVYNADSNADAELYRHDALVKVNHLPGWATLATGLKTLIHDNYETTEGSAE